MALPTEGLKFTQRKEVGNWGQNATGLLGSWVKNSFNLVSVNCARKCISGEKQDSRCLAQFSESRRDGHAMVSVAWIPKVRVNPCKALTGNTHFALYTSAFPVLCLSFAS